MNKINLLEQIGIKPDNKTLENLDIWYKAFTEYNSHTNLMSKNDVEKIFEKHVFDSLAINLWDSFKERTKILDVGCGGGFPSVILAIFFPEKKIIANDSRIKKINFIKEIKDTIKLDNLEMLYSRIEEAEKVDCDLVVSRAVGKIIDIYELSKKHIGKNTKFLIYKAKTAEEEIAEFKKKYKKAEFEIIPYKLPLKENHERNLVVLEG